METRLTYLLAGVAERDLVDVCERGEVGQPEVTRATVVGSRLQRPLKLHLLVPHGDTALLQDDGTSQPLR